MKFGPAAATVSLLLIASAGQAAPCPAIMSGPAGFKQGAKVAEFPTGEIASQTGLAVNPDGTTASYTVGDHGFTYIANGLNRILNGQKRSCTGDNKDPECRDKWLEAEKGDFAKGTPEFCSFALEVEHFSAADKKINCEGSKSRWVIGNGKGRPRFGQTVPTVDGTGARTYISTTSLRHMVGDKVAYVDSAFVPSLVVPKGRPDLLGAVAWVKWGKFSTFAVMGDSGPSFGEGSLALHQMLRRGRIEPPPQSGPIPVALRCTALENKLLPPFASRPDKKGDVCKIGYVAKAGSDIRGYAGIADNVVTVVLAKAKLQMSGKIAKSEITIPVLEKAARDAGYTQNLIVMMASCVE